MGKTRSAKGTPVADGLSRVIWEGLVGASRPALGPTGRVVTRSAERKWEPSGQYSDDDDHSDANNKVVTPHIYEAYNRCCDTCFNSHIF